MDSYTAYPQSSLWTNWNNINMSECGSAPVPKSFSLKDSPNINLTVKSRWLEFVIVISTECDACSVKAAAYWARQEIDTTGKGGKFIEFPTKFECKADPPYKDLPKPGHERTHVFPAVPAVPEEE